MKTNKLFFLVFFSVISFTYSQCWKSVSVGYTHALAIGGNNTLWAWGNNNRGQLGIGTNISNNAPAQVLEAERKKQADALSKIKMLEEKMASLPVN